MKKRIKIYPCIKKATCGPEIPFESLTTPCLNTKSFYTCTLYSLNFVFHRINHSPQILFTLIAFSARWMAHCRCT